MSRPEVDGVNAGFAQAILDDYLANPEAVPAEWRELFESGDSTLLTALPGLARLLEARTAGNGAAAPAVAPAPVAPPPQPEAPPEEPAAAAAPAPAVDEELLGGVAAAMALVKAFRTHGHLAARLDPLGSGAARRPGARAAAARAAAHARAPGPDPGGAPPGRVRG